MLAQPLTAAAPPAAQAAKIGMFYFMSTSIVIFPVTAIAAILGTTGAFRYLYQRTRIGGFDSAVVRAAPRPPFAFDAPSDLPAWVSTPTAVVVGPYHDGDSGKDLPLSPSW